MSGVGITGLIKALNNGPFPVWEDIDGYGGYRCVADITARDAIYANERKIGMEVKTQSDGNIWTLVGGILNANWQLSVGQSPFRMTYYIDPNFTGVQKGSQSNPFTTTAAGFAAAIAAGFTGALLLLPPNTALTENVVFPSTGGNWEIASVGVGIVGSTGGSRITGSVTCDATAATQIRLTNLSITGNTTGLCSAGSISFMETAVRQNGSITLTTSGAGVISAFFRGIGPVGPSKQGGSNTLLVSVAGQIMAENWVFEGGCTEAPTTTLTPYYGSTWRSCQLGSTNGVAVPINLNGGTLNAFFFDCVAAGPVTFAAGVANYTIYMDGATMGTLNNSIAGIILTGTNVQLKTINANASARRTDVNNVGSTPFGSRNVDGLYEVVCDQTLLVAGTTGSGQLNVIYTDMTGTLVTVPVGDALNIVSAVGTKAQGSIRFRHNGAAAPIAFSYTGIVTPGTLSVAISIALICRS